MKKKAEILTENLVFIILNILFFSILALFVFIKSDDASLIEEAYAKKIALVLDAAKPGMNITLDMASALKKKDKKYTGKIIDIQNNLVTVKLSKKGSYSYSFFNDILINQTYFYDEGHKEYAFSVERYK
jgi:hypothetical protein